MESQSADAFNEDLPNGYQENNRVISPSEGEQMLAIVRKKEFDKASEIFGRYGMDHTTDKMIIEDVYAFMHSPYAQKLKEDNPNDYAFMEGAYRFLLDRKNREKEAEKQQKEAQIDKEAADRIPRHEFRFFDKTLFRKSHIDTVSDVKNWLWDECAHPISHGGMPDSSKIARELEFRSLGNSRTISPNGSGSPEPEGLKDILAKAEISDDPDTWLAKTIEETAAQIQEAKNEDEAYLEELAVKIADQFPGADKNRRFDLADKRILPPRGYQARDFFKKVLS